MSVDATRYVWELDLSAYTKKSTKRLVLLALADRANKEGTCFPSIARVCADTCLDRKTVMSTINDLIDIGVIEDTGERKGATMQVRVLRFKEISSKTVVNSDINGGKFPNNGGKSGTRNLKEPKIESNINKDSILKNEYKKSNNKWIPKHLYHQHMKDKVKQESFNKEMIVSEGMKKSFDEGFSNPNATKGIPEDVLNRLPKHLLKRVKRI